MNDDAQLKALIRAMPDGKLTVGSIVEEKNEVVFTVVASFLDDQAERFVTEVEALTL